MASLRAKSSRRRFFGKADSASELCRCHGAAGRSAHTGAAAAELQDIHRQGDRLAKKMTVRELMLYRQMVKQFLEDTIRRGVGLKEVRGFDRRGRVKRYKLLDEIDATLVSMAEDLLDTEEGRIELLNKIGEIRGILINLMF